MSMDALDLKSYIRTIPDWPEPGIMFRDITPLVSDPEAMEQAAWQMSRLGGATIDKIAAIEARGFIFAGGVSLTLGAGIILLRKLGKLPYETISEEYQLEYGTDSLHMHTDAVEPGGEDVMVIDDLIATGGTAVAAVNLLRRGGANVVAAHFVIDLPDLGGADRLREMGVNVMSLMEFSGH